MSMTAEQRKEWAYANLDRYLRDIDVQEFLDAVADVSHLEDRVLDLENTYEDTGGRLNAITATQDAILDDLESLSERMDEKSA